MQPWILYYIILPILFTIIGWLFTKIYYRFSKNNIIEKIISEAELDEYVIIAGKFCDNIQMNTKPTGRLLYFKIRKNIIVVKTDIIKCNEFEKYIYVCNNNTEVSGFIKEPILLHNISVLNRVKL